MLFITNRMPVGSVITEYGRNFEFNINNNDAGASVFFCDYDAASGVSTELGYSHFFMTLFNSAPKNLVFFIHGFNNFPADVLSLVYQMNEQYGNASPEGIQFIPVIWPASGGYGLINKYFNDYDASMRSDLAFARAIALFFNYKTNNLKGESFGKNMYVMAHSMGNLTLCSLLHRWRFDNSQYIDTTLFKTAFLIAADIEDNALEAQQDGEVICQLSTDVIVYHARDDYVLGASIAINMGRTGYGSHRLGSHGPRNPKLIYSNVHVIDCSAVNNLINSELGHSYYFIPDRGDRMTAVMSHIITAIRDGEIRATL